MGSYQRKLIEICTKFCLDLDEIQSLLDKELEKNQQIRGHLMSEISRYQWDENDYFGFCAQAVRKIEPVNQERAFLTEKHNDGIQLAEIVLDQIREMF